MAAVLAVTAFLPIPMKIEPDVEYSRWTAATEFVAAHKGLPLLYVFNINNNRFLDDLTLFTIADWSYIMEEAEYTAGDFQEVLAGKNVDDGLVVIANYGYGNQDYLDTLKEVTGLEGQEYIFRLNSADLYYLYK